MVVSILGLGEILVERGLHVQLSIMILLVSLNLRCMNLTKLLIALKLWYIVQIP